MSSWNPATRLVARDTRRHGQERPCAPPLHLSATFVQEDPLEPAAFDYTRTDNPTRAWLEEDLAALEGAARTLAFTSGMAALATLLRTLRPGQRVVAGADLYGGSFRLLAQAARVQGLVVQHVDPAAIVAGTVELPADTRLVWVESPTNPLQEVVDLRALARVVHRGGARLAVDGTLCSPWLLRPLELGADVSVQSATKHLGGHADLMAGTLSVRDEEFGHELFALRNAEGNGLAPFDAWLLSRGLSTLGVRLERAQVGARAVAHFLAGHPAVTRVRYVGLADHPGHALHASQADGPGCVLSFETGDGERSRALVRALELFSCTVSFGSVRSTVSLPCSMSHASIPAAARARHAPPADLVRLSIGLEDPRDLVQDLDQALARSVLSVGGAS